MTLTFRMMIRLRKYQ